MNRKTVWLLIVFGVIVFIAGPLFVQYNHWPKGSSGNGDWLSFWGSYIGVIPSGMIAYVVAKIQITNDNNQHKINIGREIRNRCLLQINKKLRNLDPVFHYGRTKLSFINNEFGEVTQIDTDNHEDMEQQLENLCNTLKQAEEFVIVGEVLLDISMMPNLKDTDIYNKIKSLQNDFKMMAFDVGIYYSDEISEEDKIRLFNEIKKLYHLSFSDYQKILKEISNELYCK